MDIIKRIVVGTDLSARSTAAVSMAVELAETVGADLIVVGNKRMQAAARLLGSVPNKVAHKAGCSVLIARTA